VQDRPLARRSSLLGVLAKPKTAGLQIICLLAVLPHLVPSSTSLGSLVAAVISAVACVPAVAGVINVASFAAVTCTCVPAFAGIPAAACVFDIAGVSGSTTVQLHLYVPPAGWVLNSRQMLIFLYHLKYK
jgi:hypothetical protein